MRQLDTLESGESGIISKNSAPKPLKARLLSMGFLRGNRVEMLTRSMIGATLLVRLNQTNHFSLRQEEAQYIYLANADG